MRGSQEPAQCLRELGCGIRLLGFAELTAGDIVLTPLARQFAHADLEPRKQMFARQLATNMPLTAHIKQMLKDRSGCRAPAVCFVSELEDHLSESAAQQTLRAVTHWGRYAELYSYDDAAESFSLEQDAE